MKNTFKVGDNVEVISPSGHGKTGTIQVVDNSGVPYYVKYSVGGGWQEESNLKLIPPTPRTIEQIETELEVLREELNLLKAEAQPKKKPIEFVKYLRSNTMSVDDEPLCKPSRYKHVELVFRYDHYDIMKAWSRDDKKDTTIYLGNFNDGIK